MPAFVVADSQVERTALEPSYPAAATALEDGDTRDGGRAGERRAAGRDRDADPARRTRRGGSPSLSPPLEDVDDNVSLITRQILIAGRDRAGGGDRRRLPRGAGALGAAPPARGGRREGRSRRFLDADPGRLRGRGRPARDDARGDARPPRPARRRAQGVHRERLARAANADLLAGRIRRAASTRTIPIRPREPSSWRPCASRSSA